MNVYVVTGAGRGLGRELAIALARHGVTVAALGREGDGLAGTVAAGAGRIHPVLCDVADPQSVKAAFAEVDALGPLAGLINNAALYPRRDTLDETFDSLMAVMATNFGGTAACSYEALARMCERGEGRILNVGSFADLAPIPASGAYATSKGAVRILTRAMVADLAFRFPRIIISDWMPGILATDMGPADGLDPAIAAAWGARLALMQDDFLQGSTWERDQEVPPPRGLKGRLLDRLRGIKPRKL